MAMRIFLGTFLNRSNQAFYDRLMQQLCTRHSTVLRAIPAASAHVTYVFIPELNQDLLGSLLATLADVAGRGQAFDVELTAPKVLRAGLRPRLVCAEHTRGGEEVGRLTAALSTALSVIAPNLSPSRAPHVTLARFRRDATRRDADDVAESLCRADGRADRVSVIQVVESVLTPTGPVYVVKGESRLCEDGAVAGGCP